MKKLLVLLLIPLFSLSSFGQTEKCKRITERPVVETYVKVTDENKDLIKELGLNINDLKNLKGTLMSQSVWSYWSLMDFDCPEDVPSDDTYLFYINRLVPYINYAGRNWKNTTSVTTDFYSRPILKTLFIHLKQNYSVEIIKWEKYLYSNTRILLENPLLWRYIEDLPWEIKND